MGTWLTPEKRPSPTRVILWSFYIKRCGRNEGNPSENFDSSRSVSQGRSRSSEPIRIDWLPRKGTPKLGSAGVGRGLPLKSKRPPHVFHHVKFGPSALNVYRHTREPSKLGSASWNSALCGCDAWLFTKWRWSRVKSGGIKLRTVKRLGLRRGCALPLGGLGSCPSPKNINFALKIMQF